MGNVISNLLNAEEPKFSNLIKDLERTSANPSEDVRLMSEIIQSVRARTNQLGLDSSDTVGEELYYALLNKARLHDQHLAKHIGVDAEDHVDKIAKRIRSVILKSNTPISAWVIKKSVAKRLLHNIPPTKVMKLMNYTSIDSMTKRESMAEIMGVARLVETSAWLRKFNNQYSSLTPVDFESRDIEIVIMSDERWGFLSEKLINNRSYSLTHLKELGFISVFAPKQDRIEGYTLSTMPIILHYINEIRLYSAYFKSQQVRSGFGKVVASTLNNDSYSFEISGKRLHWRVVQRHYGRPEHTNHPDVLQPHVQPEDLHWRRAEESLFKIDPELSFWKGLDYVGVVLNSNQPISFNLLDVSMNYYFALSYNDRIYSHMRASLWNELYIRYLGHKVFEEQVLNQLSGAINLDSLKF